jgi:hypothetical protein
LSEKVEIVLRKRVFSGEEEFIEKRGYFICYLGILLKRDFLLNGKTIWVDDFLDLEKNQ